MPSITKQIEIIIAGVGRMIDVEVNYVYTAAIRGVQDGGVAVSPDEPARVEIDCVFTEINHLPFNLDHLFTDEQITALENEIEEGL